MSQPTPATYDRLADLPPRAAVDWHDPTFRQFVTGAVREEARGGARRCFFVDRDCRQEGGYVPVLVVIDEPGIRPMIGPRPPDSTWFWGTTLDEAKRIADLVNHEAFGVDADEANQIIAANMALPGSVDDDDDECSSISLSQQEGTAGEAPRRDRV